MPLHVITGRANAGKTGAVNAALIDSLSRGESPTLVLPSVADVRRATSELSVKMPLGVAVVPWERWIDSMWALHGDGRRVVSRSARAAFVDRAIETAGSGPIPMTNGLRIVLRRAVAVAGADPKTISAPTAALRYIVTVCGHYARLLAEAGLVERGSVLSLLAANPPAPTGTVALNRFTELSGPQLALIEAVAGRAEVFVALTWERGFAPTAALDATAEHLSACAFHVQHEAEPETESELSRLGNVLYSSASVVAEGAVRMAVAEGEEAEAAVVASHAADAVAGGIAPDRIVVAFPRLAGRAHAVASAMRAEGLDVELDLVRPLDTLPLGRTVGGLLDLALGSGTRATANAALLGPHSDVTAERAAAIDSQWRSWRIEEPARLLSDIAQVEDSRLAAAARTARGLANGAGHQDVRKWQLLLDALVSVPCERVLTPGGALDAEVAEALRSDAAVSSAIARLVGEMLSVEGAAATLSDIRAALREASAGGTTGERAGAVQVTELARLGSRRFDVVIIGGLTADEAPVGDADSLSDEVIELMTGETPAPRELSVRLRFYQAVSRPRTRLVLIRRVSDSQGCAVRPSVLWDEAVGAYRTDADDPEEWPAKAPELERRGAARIAESAPVFSEGRRAARVAAVASASRQGRAAQERIVSAEALAALAARDVFSATEIEAYLACPYKWFYERVVRPEEIDREVDARALGTYAHTLLSRFYGALPERTGERRVTPATLSTCRGLLAEIAEASAAELRARGLAEELAMARARRWAESAVDEDASLLPGFEPIGHEVAFPDDGGAAVELGGVKFAGRIDRIDRGPGGVFVTDYKTSQAVSGYASFAEEGKIQAVVYALAAEKLTGAPCAGSVYRSLKSRALRGFWRADRLGAPLAHGEEKDALGDVEIAALVEDAGARVAEAVEGIRAGGIERKPGVKKACAYCAVRLQCEGGRQ